MLDPLWRTARDLLGYAPGVDLDEGLRRTVESFKAKGGAA